MSRRRLRAAIALAVLGSPLLLAPTAARASSAGAGPAVPLASSFAENGAAWVTLPMGRLDTPVDTFWQLFERTPDGAGWKLMTPPGVADQGGLVGAPTATGIVTGFETSQDLGFSPLASTSDGGRNWSGGALNEPLAKVPDALASLDGAVYALVGSSGERQVVTGAAAGTTWRRVTDDAAVRSGARSGCAVSTISALAAGAHGLLVGARCSAGNAIGVFAEQHGSWSLVGTTPPGVRDADVLAITSENGNLEAIVAQPGRRGASVEFATLAAGARRWRLSPALALFAGEQLASLAFGAGRAGVVLTRSGENRVELSAGGTWQALPDVRGAAASLSLARAGEVDLLTANDTEMRPYTHRDGQRGWRGGAAVEAPISFGSSG